MRSSVALLATTLFLTLAHVNAQALSLRTSPSPTTSVTADSDDIYLKSTLATADRNARLPNVPLGSGLTGIFTDPATELRLPGYEYSAPQPGCAASGYSKTIGECPGATRGDVNAEDAYDVAMYSTNVTYNDCGSPFTVCYCQSANLTLFESMDALGRVPVGLRRYAGTIVVLPDTQAHAYTVPSGESNGEIHVFGVPSQRSWIHEVSHAYDFATEQSWSGTQEWAEAVAKDECIPDTYAQTNLIEDFAQTSVLKIFLLHAQQTGNTTALTALGDLSCMANALDILDTLPLYDPGTLFGDTCAIEDGETGARHTIAPSQNASTSASATNSTGGTKDANPTTSGLTSSSKPSDDSTGAGMSRFDSDILSFIFTFLGMAVTIAATGL